MRTKQVLKTVLLSEMTLSLFGFVTCLQNHISLSDECDTSLSTSECFWLRLNWQSFYLYRKRQLVPTDRYRFRSIGKLIGSVSHDRVAYRYLDAFPNVFYIMILNTERNHNSFWSNFSARAESFFCRQEKARAAVVWSLRAKIVIVGNSKWVKSHHFCAQLIIMMIVYSTFLQHKLNYKAGH